MHWVDLTFLHLKILRLSPAGSSLRVNDAQNTSKCSKRSEMAKIVYSQEFHSCSFLPSSNIVWSPSFNLYYDIKKKKGLHRRLALGRINQANRPSFYQYKWQSSLSWQRVNIATFTDVTDLSETVEKQPSWSLNYLIFVGNDKQRLCWVCHITLVSSNPLIYPFIKSLTFFSSVLNFKKNEKKKLVIILNTYIC